MAASLEHRIALLEQQVARLRQQFNQKEPTGREWLDDLNGAFAGDRIFEEAMKLGREYRESTRPASRAAKARR